MDERVCENKKVEILAPAGSYESLRAALCAGADAVYIGGDRFGARAYAENFSEEELLRAIDEVHLHGRRIYLAVNTLLKDREMNQLYAFLRPYYQQGVDGIIVQDFGVLRYVREFFPDLPVHASTQMTITNRMGAAFLKEQGVARVVPARELSLEELCRMKAETGLEIECFVHGAMCYCYSGQCLMSSMIGGRSGNRGQCAQPCRLPYRCYEKNGKPVWAGAKDFMSLKDLCTIDLLPELVEAGIDSFKIEGRMKQPEYVYMVTAMYRRYLDQYYQEGKGNYQVAERDRLQLMGAYQRRGYTDGYYRRHNGKEMISFRRPENEEGRSRHSGQKEENVHCESHKQMTVQEKINGNLILSMGKRAKLELEHGDTRTVCEGPVTEPAKNQPLDAGRVERQMRKTGNTEFVFEDFHVTIEGEPFLPIQALNELRREGLQKLSEQMLSPYRRSIGTFPEKTLDMDRHMFRTSSLKNREYVFPEIRLSAFVQSIEQLETVMKAESIDCIYMDNELGLQTGLLRQICHTRRGKKYYLALPYIFREDTLQRMEAQYPLLETYDGVLLRNWDELSWLQRHHYQKEMISDYHLYVFNRHSKEFLLEQGGSRYTAPAELNAGELKELDIRDGVLACYGYQPVMVTANCIRKTCGKCSKKEGFLTIRDRYQKSFAVKTCCADCYNVIYNSAPLYLADRAEEVRVLAPGEVRLDFTVETAEETTQVLQEYTNAFICCRKVEAPKTEFTRGHFKRGVK